MPIAERVLKVKTRVIKRTGVDVKDVSDRDTRSVAGLRILDNHVARVLNETMSDFLPGNLVKAPAALSVGEWAGWQRFIAQAENSGSGRGRGRWQRRGRWRRRGSRW